MQKGRGVQSSADRRRSSRPRHGSVLRSQAAQKPLVTVTGIDTSALTIAGTQQARRATHHVVGDERRGSVLLDTSPTLRIEQSARRNTNTVRAPLTAAHLTPFF